MLTSICTHLWLPDFVWFLRKEVDVPVIKHVEIEDVQYVEKYIEAWFACF
jgi:hypothetical protein